MPLVFDPSGPTGEAIEAAQRAWAMVADALPFDPRTERREAWASAVPYLVAAAALAATLWAGSRARAYLRERPVLVRIPLPEAAQPGWSGKALTPPRIRADDKPGVIQCYDPATGYHLDDIPADTPETIDAKLARAATAQQSWAHSPFPLRRKLMRTLAAWSVASGDDIARVAMRDTGKTAVDAAFGELLTTAAKASWLASPEASRALADETRGSPLLLTHKVCTVHREPLGVVAALVSWNYPAHNVLGPALAGLFAGNAVLLKPSEQVAWSARYYVQAVRACLAAVGANEDLVQLVTCFPEHAEAVTRHPRVAHLTFIGSDAVGQKVAQAAAQNLTPTTLELGGKDPALILPGTNLPFYAPIFMRAAFQGAGQNCIGIERFLVADTQEAELVALVKQRVAQLQTGSWLDDTPSYTVDCGAMITDARFDRLEQLIEDAVRQGAVLHAGGKRVHHVRWPAGHFFAPTLLSGVRPEMEIANEELFAPIFLVMPYLHTDTRAAVRIANGTRYGLGSSVFGPNKAQAEQVAQQLDAGMVNINDFGVSYLNQSLPFGGVKASGYGRFGGIEGLQGLTAPKAVTRDRFFSTVRTQIPPPVDYPLTKAKTSERFTAGLLKLAYGTGIDRVRGLAGLVGSSLGF